MQELQRKDAVTAVATSFSRYHIINSSEIRQRRKNGFTRKYLESI